MPVAALVCPHCEKPVELQVTAVTRSRPCPHCGKHIMLQFTQKQGRVKRKALLVNAKGGLDFDSLKNDVPVDEPMPLPGDAFERMRADPELIAIKKRFAWSMGIVASLILIATIFHLNRDRWFPQNRKPALLPVAVDAGGVPPSSVPKDTRIATDQRPEKKPEKLDFTLPEKMAAPSAAPSQTTHAPALSAAPRLGARTPVPGVPLVPAGASGKVAGAPVTKSGAMLGALPRSLFKIARKGAAPQVQHDLVQAKTVLVSFLKAANVNQRLQFVADRGSVEARVRAYYEKTGDAPVAFTAITDSEVVGNGAVSEHDVALANGRLWRASVVKTAEGGYLVDWPSFVAEGEMGWMEFVQRKSSQPVMLRVAAEAGQVFGGDFSDGKWLMCVKLTHPSHPDAPPVYAYVERQSVLGREMDYWIKLGEGQAMPMTVRVKYPPIASADNQVWLSDLVAPGWVLRSSQPVVQAKGSTGDLGK